MATNMYLEISDPKIEGESTDEIHPNQIEVLSFSHGVSQPTSATVSVAGGRTTERCHHQDFVISRYMDKATPELNLHCCQGTHFKKIVLRCYRATGENATPVEYMVYELENNIISSISVGGGAGDLPVETITFNYGKISWTYTTQGHTAPGGKGANKPTHWDLATNKGG